MNQPKVAFRSSRPDDIEALVNLAERASKADQVDPQSTLEGVAPRESLSNPEILIAEDAETGSILGYGAIRWWQEDDGTFVYRHTGAVDPSARRKGVGLKLLGELQHRAHAMAESHPASRKVFAANASQTEIGAGELLEKDGYKKVWSQVEMSFTGLNTLARVPIPSGFELRPVKSEREKRLVYDANKKVYAGQFGNSQPSEEDYQEFLQDNPDTSLWKVLWHGEDVAGFVLSKKRPSGAEIMEVSVLPEYRRRGLGTCLMIESMLDLRERGVDEVRLHTGTEGKNGGRQLYESLGFTALKEHYRYRKPMSQQFTAKR